MNIVLLEDHDFIRPDRAVLRGRRFEHLKTVNRVKLSDKLFIGKLNGKTGKGQIRKIAADFFELDIIHLDQPPPEPLPVILVMALPRPKMLKRIIETVTTLGVKQIHLINSWRVEKSFWQTPVLNDKYISEYVRAGLEQAKDTIEPEIKLHRFFTPFAKQVLPKIAKETVKIVAHPKGNAAFPSNMDEPVTLVVGPEGGFIEIEIDTFKDAGFRVCHAGPRIMRVETAVTFLLSRLFCF